MKEDDEIIILHSSLSSEELEKALEEIGSDDWFEEELKESTKNNSKDTYFEVNCTDGFSIRLNEYDEVIELCLEADNEGNPDNLSSACEYDNNDNVIRTIWTDKDGFLEVDDKDAYLVEDADDDDMSDKELAEKLEAGFNNRSLNEKDTDLENKFKADNEVFDVCNKPIKKRSNLAKRRIKRI